MINLKRVATFKDTVNSKEAVILEIGSKKIVIKQSDLTTFDTPTKLKTEADRQFGSTLKDVFFHINRDGSIAVATGQKPNVWPEDERI